MHLRTNMAFYDIVYYYHYTAEPFLIIYIFIQSVTMVHASRNNITEKCIRQHVMYTMTVLSGADIMDWLTKYSKIQSNQLNCIDGNFVA